MLNNIGLPGLLLVAVVIFMVFVPATMARRRNRSGLLWVLIGFVATPILAILLLIALGDAPRTDDA